MKEKPILFSGPMVRAILEGRKTQTRRIVKPQPPKGYRYGYAATDHSDNVESFGFGPPNFPDRRKLDVGKEDCRRVHWFTSPYGQPGDRLIVKEHVWMWCEKRPNGVTKKGRPKFRYVPMREAEVYYCAYNPQRPIIGYASPDTGNEWCWRKKLGRFMPRWASRITLEVTKVRVERLQDINRGGAMAEGCPFMNIAKMTKPLGWYRDLWESINGPGSWAANPWVWVVEFRRITP